MRALWSKRKCLYNLKGLTWFTCGGGGDEGDGHHQFKTSKINNKHAVEADVVYVYTKANTDIH